MAYTDSLMPNTVFGFVLKNHIFNIFDFNILMQVEEMSLLKSIHIYIFHWIFGDNKWMHFFMVASLGFIGAVQKYINFCRRFFFWEKKNIKINKQWKGIIFWNGCKLNISAAGFKKAKLTNFRVKNGFKLQLFYKRMI